MITALAALLNEMLVKLWMLTYVHVHVHHYRKVHADAMHPFNILHLTDIQIYIPAPKSPSSLLDNSQLSCHVMSCQFIPFPSLLGINQVPIHDISYSNSIKISSGGHKTDQFLRAIHT